MAYSGETPLTPKGEKQAAAMAEFLSAINFDIAVSSPYLRSKQTANIILGESSGILETSEYFREIDIELHRIIGDVDTAEEAVRLLAESMWRVPETFSREIDDCVERIEEAVAYLLSKDWSVALVAAHSGFNRLFICHLLGIPTEFIRVFEQDHAGMSILELDIDNQSKRFIRSALRELNVTAYDPAKSSTRLMDMEKLALETKPLLEKMLSRK